MDVKDWCTVWCPVILTKKKPIVISNSMYGGILSDMYYMAQYSLVTISLANATVVANIAARATWFTQPPNILKKVGWGSVIRYILVQLLQESVK